MKKIFVILGLLTSAQLVSAQGSWKIVLNNKLVLLSHESDEPANTRSVKSSDWKKNGYLEITFKESPASSWHHALKFFDEKGNELLTRDSTLSARVPTATLRRVFKGKKTLTIRLEISPPDPRMEMPTRLLHLVTLKLP